MGIIGTGATAVQVIPHLGASAKQLYVFQRTPSGVGVRDNQPTDEAWVKTLKPGWQQERIRNFTAIVSGREQDVDLVRDGWTYIFQDTESRRAESPEAAAELRQMADFQILTEQSQHAAYIIGRCLKQGIETIEPTEQAQQQWWEVILSHLTKQPVEARWPGTCGTPRASPGILTAD